MQISLKYKREKSEYFLKMNREMFKNLFYENLPRHPGRFFDCPAP